MKIIPKRPKTGSSLSFDLLVWVLLAVLPTVSPLRASAQRKAWVMPQYQETMSIGSAAVGYAFARDTYLSASRYDGWAVGFENDIWTGYDPDRIFRYGRTHASLFFSPMTNRNDGGSTMEMGGCDYAGFLWPAVESSMCDLLIGPAAMFELGILYNQQNSNNPVNMEGYVGAGVCVDNTFRFSLFRYGMAFQATLYMPLAGMGFAPDYDQPYWYMYRYGEYGKALHFITPFNNTTIMQQVGLIFPVKRSRLRVGYTFNYTGNSLGGHSRSIGNGMFTIGCAMRFQTKDWDK